MTSNSVNMSVEDLLVQDLKSNKLGALIGDEDALAKLAKRAINEALFEERYVTEGSGYHERRVRKLSPVMEAADLVCKQAIEKVMGDIVKELLEKPETKKAITNAIAALFPSIVLRFLDQTAINLHKQIQTDAINKLAFAFMSNGDQATTNIINSAHNQYTPSNNPITG